MIALFVLASAPTAPMEGVWECTPSGSVFAATWRPQTEDKTVMATQPKEFRYQGFEFAFGEGQVSVKMRDNGQNKEQRVPYFRQGNYVTFNFNEGLNETGWATPITFWSNEASNAVPRYQVSFPLSVPRAMKTMSGDSFEAGDAAMAVAAISCQKKTAS